MEKAETRLEHDLLGELEIRKDAYFGIHTQRAFNNFPVTGTPISSFPNLIKAIAIVKEACALANLDFGLLSKTKADAIIQACKDIQAGELHSSFIVDIVQGGAGTSTNMNANEVIANRGLELMGFPLGSYADLHPLEDVNMSQSTNDVYPTAVKIALNYEITKLIDAMSTLADAFENKSIEFSMFLKVGRTQLQDAVPMTLGQEFSTYNVMLKEDQLRLQEASKLIQEINLGATAIGTGINAPAGFAKVVCQHLRQISALELVTAENLVEATQDAGAFVQLSGVLKRVAVKLSKTCNDLRLLSSGPRAGFGEINLPAVQAGSSIMPGKVNPVIPEVVNQIAFDVIGNDLTITMAAEAGQLQLNAFEPIITKNLMNSIIYLRQGCLILAEKCVRGITANEDRLAEIFNNSISTVTALNTILGYEKATFVAKEAFRLRKSVKQILLDNALMAEQEIDELFSPSNLIQNHNYAQ